MHWEYFVKNKGKLERYKKKHRAKKQIKLNITKWKVLMANIVPAF